MLCAQITGPDVVPFDEVKQNALLLIIYRLLPRVAAGVGPRYTLAPSVEDHPGNQTSRATIIMISGDHPLKFAQARLFSATAVLNL